MSFMTDRILTYRVERTSKIVIRNNPFRFYRLSGFGKRKHVDSEQLKPCLLNKVKVVLIVCSLYVHLFLRFYQDIKLKEPHIIIKSPTNAIFSLSLFKTNPVIYLVGFFANEYHYQI